MPAAGRKGPPDERCHQDYWRRGGDWDIAAERDKVETWGCDPFLLYTLEAAQQGREHCGGCRHALATRDIALVTLYVAYDNSKISVTSYCLGCAERHADELANMTRRELSS
jgi:hypothetical protein